MTAAARFALIEKRRRSDEPFELSGAQAVVCAIESVLGASELRLVLDVEALD